VSSSELPEDLPAGLLIPGRIRSPIDVIRFANCAAESDLPARLIFGGLVPGSFERFPSGFRVRYISAYLSAALVNKDNNLRLEVTVDRGDPVYNMYHDWPMDSAQGRLYQLAATKPDLDRALRAVFETDYNVRYKCGELFSESGAVAYLPDGYAVSILVPFPVNTRSCANLVSFVDAIQRGPEIFCEGHLERQVIVTNYREGRCPDLELETRSVLLNDVNRGLIPLGIPAWQGESDRAFTSRRIGYVLVIETFLYDLADVLGQLRNCNLIEDDAASELVAQIYDEHVVTTIRECSVFSRDRSRRVVLGFTNTWAISDEEANQNSRRDFSDQLQMICRRIQAINVPLLELLYEGPS
jgi:hypothetical protein